MADEWTVEVLGIEEAERGLALLLAGVNDLRPFWPRVSRLAIGWIGEQFETEGQAFSDPWAPLSPDYLAYKSAVFPGKKILSADGDLRRAATTPTRRAGPRELVLSIESYEHRGTGATVEPSWFQVGTDRMPARPLIGELSVGMLAALEAEAEDYAADLVRASGLR